MNGPDRLDSAIEKLLEDKSPRADLQHLDADEQRMVRMAQLLRGSQTQTPETEFVEDLRERVFPSTPRVTRRTAFLSGLGALAAGVLAGVGLDRVGGNSSPKKKTQPLVGANGRWFPVAHVADVPVGAVKSFQAGSVQGFLINHGGRYQALSRICTHMGCALNFGAAEQRFVCPCHGAEFDLDGWLHQGPDRSYKYSLPPLPKVDVRVNGDHVEVWSV